METLAERLDRVEREIREDQDGVLQDVILGDVRNFHIWTTTNTARHSEEGNQSIMPPRTVKTYSVHRFYTKCPELAVVSNFFKPNQVGGYAPDSKFKVKEDFAHSLLAGEKELVDLGFKCAIGIINTGQERDGAGEGLELAGYHRVCSGVYNHGNDIILFFKPELKKRGKRSRITDSHRARGINHYFNSQRSDINAKSYRVPVMIRNIKGNYGWPHCCGAKGMVSNSYIPKRTSHPRPIMVLLLSKKVYDPHAVAKAGWMDLFPDVLKDYKIIVGTSRQESVWNKVEDVF